MQLLSLANWLCQSCVNQVGSRSSSCPGQRSVKLEALLAGKAKVTSSLWCGLRKALKPTSF